MAHRATRPTKVNRLWLLTALTVVASWLCACVPQQVVYSHFEPTSNQLWPGDLPMRFAPQWPDSQAVCDVVVAVRHTQVYPYGDLPLVVDLVGDSSRVTRHRVRIPITDGQGNWCGQGFGTFYQCQTVVAHDVAASEARRVIVWMAIDSCSTLSGVSDVGLILIDN